MKPLSRVATPIPSEADDLFDYARLFSRLGWVVRGVGRHRLLGAAVFALVLGLGIGWAVIAPRTYHVEAKLLASRSQLIRSLGNPRTTGTPAEDPTRAADETIFARDNLLSLIKQTSLLEKFRLDRSLLGRARDASLALVVGPVTEADQLDALVVLLEKHLHVTTDAQTVVISIDWPNPQAAFQLVDTATQNFLEARHLSEMTAISEALAILEVHAATEQRSVLDALQELQRVRELRQKGTTSLQGPVPVESPGAVVLVAAPKVGAPLGPPPAFAELSQLKLLILSKRRAQADLEEFHARRLADLTGQLAEQRVQFAEKHPAVLDTIQRIAALGEPSPQMARVRVELAELLAEYRRKGGLNPDTVQVEPLRRSVVPAGNTPEPSRALSLAELADDPEVEFARNSLHVASAMYEELAARIDSARIEQDTARAAFKYRYSVVRPAALPKKPVSPNYETLFAVTLALAAFLALVSGAALERWRGVIVEPWQVAAGLGLPLLGGVTLSFAAREQKKAP